MNLIEASIKTIESCESLHVVKFVSHGQTLSMMSLELADTVAIGTKVTLCVKSSHIAIAKSFSGDVSYSNQLACKIASIDNGKLLSSITLECCETLIESIITVDSSKRMDLKVGDAVTALIKASELSISEICDV